MPDQDTLTKAAERFAEYASQYCTFLETCGPLIPYEYVVQALDILATLQREALALPEIYELGDLSTDPLSIEVPREELQALQVLASEKLGKHDSYVDVFDPMDLEDPDVVGYLISADLTEIYEELKEGLLAFRLPKSYSTSEVLWQWKFGFVYHWGRHLANVHRALSYIIAGFHYVDVEINP